MNRREFVKQATAMGLTLGGCAFLSGLGRRPGPETPPPLRPPGALAEDAFTATCIRCLRCVDACPNHALVALPVGDGSPGGGTPTLHPRAAACMLCQGERGEYLRCTEACPSGALRRVRKERSAIRENVRIGVAEIDPGLCYSYNNWSCGACFRACPLAGEAMTLTNWERPVIHAGACVGCGCCERACIRYPHAVRVKAEGVA